MSCCTRGRSQAGFTLIELLAVIAIIALLLSILLPSLVNVKGLSHHPKCQQNLRQMGIGINAYAAANAGMCPPDGVYLLPERESYDWSTNPATLVSVRPWVGGGYWYRRWSDFIQPYFDPEARPAGLKYQGGLPVGPGQPYIGLQPKDGVYDRWATSGIIYSRRMDCPAFPNSGHWEYMQTAFHGGSWWRGPERFDQPGNVRVAPDVPAAPPNWMGKTFQGNRLSDYRVEKYAAVLEPDNLRWPGIGGINMGADVEFQDEGMLMPYYWGFLRYTYSVPHVNKTTNAMYLDGHVTTFTQQYLRDFYRDNMKVSPRPAYLPFADFGPGYN